LGETVDLTRLDLSLLLGGKHFTFPCTISFNGFAISTYSLIDTGANGFIFISEKFAWLLLQKLGWKIEKLPFPSLPIKGYDGRRGPSITSFLRTHLILDGRRIYNVPFLVLPLGNHDIIIGKTFLEYFNISPNIAQRKLYWPRNHPKTTSVITPGINIPRQILQRPAVQGTHQQDMEARDQLIKLDERRQRAGHNSISHISSVKPSYVDRVTQTDLEHQQPTGHVIRFNPAAGLNPQNDNNPSILLPGQL
jgi:predicted aspartyl protease